MQRWTFNGLSDYPVNLNLLVEENKTFISRDKRVAQSIFRLHLNCLVLY